MHTTRRHFLGAATIGGVGLAAAQLENPAKSTEPIIEPDLPIVDPQHHLWFRSDADIALMQKQRGIFVQDMIPVIRRKHATCLTNSWLI
jgi:hypothetical protein